MVLKKNIFFIFFIFFILFGFYSFSQTLIKPQHSEIFAYSGDNQTQTLGKLTDNPIRVLVLDENKKPIQNYELNFSIISYPKSSKGYFLTETKVKTDKNGIANTYLQLGDKEGEYSILVRGANDINDDFLVYTVNARNKSWIFFLVIGMLGGISIFLFGMNILGKGMVSVAGNKMRDLINKFTKNRFSGLIAGFVLTLLVQSSTAASVLIIGFVEGGLMSFTQSLSMILGSAVGTTITAQLIALNITDYALLIIAIGFGFFMFSRSSKFKYLGRAILGLGFLFFGMFVISQTMAPLRNYTEFVEILIGLENPFVGIAVGFVFTVILNSTIAFIGIIITISTQGFLSIDAAIPLILGTNMGNTLIAVIASLKAGREAQRVALANILFKFSAVFIFVWWIPELSALVKSFSPKKLASMSDYEYFAETVPHQIANVHTIFNIAMAIVMLPLINFYAYIIKKILPDKEKMPFKLKYINMAVNVSPALTLSLAKKETLRMGNKIKELVAAGLIPFFDRNENILEKWQALENEADFLQKNINKYLLSVSNQSVDEQQLNDAFQIMYVVKELEMIGDIINTNLRHQATKWLVSNADFSDDGKIELEEIHLKALKQISRSMEVFDEFNQEKAAHVRSKYQKYADLAESLEKSHYERLFTQNQQTLSSSEIHLELLGLLNSVNRHATNIARILMNWQKEEDR